VPLAWIVAEAMPVHVLVRSMKICNGCLAPTKNYFARPLKVEAATMVLIRSIKINIFSMVTSMKREPGLSFGLAPGSLHLRYASTGEPTT